MSLICEKSAFVTIARKEQVNPKGPYFRMKPNKPDIREIKPNFQLSETKKTVKVNPAKSTPATTINHFGALLLSIYFILFLYFENIIKFSEIFIII